MQNYNCTVNLCDGKGLVLTQVSKSDVSAPELIMLRTIHAPENIVKISKTTMDKRSHAEERRRLENAYGPTKVAALFGPEHQKLPVEVSLGAAEAADDDDDTADTKAA